MIEDQDESNKVSVERIEKKQTNEELEMQALEIIHASSCPSRSVGSSDEDFRFCVQSPKLLDLVLATQKTMPSLMLKPLGDAKKKRAPPI